MNNRRLWATRALSVYVAFVFVQSLFYKFTGSSESILIFSTLRAWSGIELFEPFGRYLIGSAELVASILLFVPGFTVVGAAIAIGIMTGAILFHLFTPLGVEIMGDSGLLFLLACGVWVAGWTILALNRRAIAVLFDRVRTLAQRSSRQTAG